MLTAALDAPIKLTFIRTWSGKRGMINLIGKFTTVCAAVVPFGSVESAGGVAAADASRSAAGAVAGPGAASAADGSRVASLFALPKIFLKMSNMSALGTI